MGKGLRTVSNAQFFLLYSFFQVSSLFWFWLSFAKINQVHAHSLCERSVRITSRKFLKAFLPQKSVENDSYATAHGLDNIPQEFSQSMETETSKNRIVWFLHLQDSFCFWDMPGMIFLTKEHVVGVLVCFSFGLVLAFLLFDSFFFFSVCLF